MEYVTSCNCKSEDCYIRKLLNRLNECIKNDKSTTLTQEEIDKFFEHQKETDQKNKISENMSLVEQFEEEINHYFNKEK